MYSHIWSNHPTEEEELHLHDISFFNEFEQVVIKI